MQVNLIMISLFPVPSLMNSLIFTIYILFFTFKTLLTKEISLPLPFFQFFRKQLKTTHNFGHFSLQLKKKGTRDRQSFLARFAWVLFFRDSLSLSLSLADWSIGRTRDWSFDCSRLIARQLAIDLLGNGVIGGKGAFTYLLPKLCQ